MAPRSTWKGFLKLSLVSVPVKAFTANNSSEEVRLNQLHKDCNSRVKYQKVCPEHGELSSDQIVSGYEFQKGQYVVVDTQEVAKLRRQSDKSVSIAGFIAPEEVDARFHAGRTYYLLPDGLAGNKPYALLHRGMRDANVHAIAQMVISGRDQLVVLRPLEELLAITVLNYADGVKGLDEFESELEPQELADEERALASTLISASFLREFKMDRFKDDYVKNLKKLIQMKIDGQEVVEAVEHEEPKIVNLMEALKQSVAQAQAAALVEGGTGAAAQKKKAPSAGGAKKAQKKSG